MPNTSVPAAATGLPIPHPRLVELVARRELRTKVEKAVTRLIDVLDALDGDPDLEPDTDREPEVDEETLGWPANVSQLALGENTADGDITAPERHGRGFVRCGAEDAEPCLGAPDGRADQRHWADGAADDRERDDDREPTLGQPEGVYHNQQLWGRIGGTAHEDEDDHRRHPGYAEGCRLVETSHA